MKRLILYLVYGALAVTVAGLGAYLAVSLVVEQAPEVVVPDLVGQGLSEALDELQGTGLDLEIRRFVFSDEVPENCVVRQRPEGGARVRAGRGVGVTLSRGPERHPAPDVRNRSMDDCRILLEEAGLTPKISVRIPWGPENTVVAQGVAPGRRLGRGTAVDVVVSSGPRPVRLVMPHLEGLSLDEALEELDGVGLRADRVEEQNPEDPSLRGRIVGQAPLPGFPILQGGSVTLTVAGRATRSRRADAVVFAITPPAGFARHRVELSWEFGGRTWVLDDDWIPGGTAYRRWLPLRPGERAVLRLDGREMHTEER